MIMLLIPRLLVAVAVMLMVTDVGVIAWRLSWPSFSWKPQPSLAREILLPRQPYVSPTIREHNNYGPYKPDLSSWDRDYAKDLYMKYLEKEFALEPKESELNSYKTTTNEDSQSLEVTTRTAWKYPYGWEQFLRKSSKSNTSINKAHGQVVSTTPVVQSKAPGATVEHNILEKELQATKNLGQQQLPAEN